MHFFHCYIKWGSTIIFKYYVTYPDKRGEELEKHCRELETSGLHGCVALMKATHITMRKYQFTQSNEHMGVEESLPSKSKMTNSPYNNRTSSSVE